MQTYEPCFPPIYSFHTYEHTSEYKLHYWHLLSSTFPLFSISPSLSSSTVHVSDKPFIPPRTFLPSELPSREITHSMHNGICSYRLGTERPRTHICSRIPQTINNSLLMFKSHFSDKVPTIKRNKLRRRWRGRLSRPGDVGESFSQSFFFFFSRRADSSELAIISGTKLIKVARSESMGEFAAARRTERRTDGKSGVTAMTPLQKRRLAQRQNSAALISPTVWRSSWITPLPPLFSPSISPFLSIHPRLPHPPSPRRTWGGLSSKLVPSFHPCNSSHHYQVSKT